MRSASKLWRTVRWLPLGLALPALLGGCPTRPIKKVDPERVGESNNPFVQNLNRDIDILFLIDNSGSMADKQSHLAAKFPDFIDRLSSLPGGLPNVHIGIATSDMGAGPYSLQSCERQNGDHGLLQNTPRVPGCTPPSGRYISDVDSPTGRVKNYTGNLRDVFTCIARVGSDGCGFEQHFEGMKRALDESNPENAGFVRQGAFLAVILLADEDDCSAKAPGAMYDPSQMDLSSPLGALTSFRCTEFGVKCNPDLPWRTMPGPRMACVSNENSQYEEPVQKYIDFLIGLKGGAKNKVIVAGIIGNPSPVEVGVDAQNNPLLLPSCSASQIQNGDAVPGIREAQLINAFGDNGTIVSICDNDFTPALQRIGDLIAAALGKQCIRGNVADVPTSDPTAIEVQGSPVHISCTVADVRDFGTDRAQETIIPACSKNGGAQPCWDPMYNPGDCPVAISPSSIEFKVNRSGPPDGDVTAIVRCLTIQ